jgi:hypothetical protein
MKVEDKRNEPAMMPRLKALIKRAAEVRKAGLEACHCAKEFTLRRICPLGRREKLAFECPWPADPNRYMPTCKILNLFLSSML